MSEIILESGFLDVLGYEGLYAVNEHGDVYCYPKDRGLRGSTPGKMMKKSYTTHGYVRAFLRKDGHTKFAHVHRLVADAFIPNPGGLPILHHKDDNKKNNYVGNLEWSTHSRNLKLAYAHGLNYGRRGRPA
jgi:hypothetical protein